MIQRLESLSEVNERAVRLLVKELGVVDAGRFLKQFGVGPEDYTTERDHLFEGKSAAELAEEIRQWRAARER